MAKQSGAGRPKILVFGKNGQVGSQLVTQLKDDNNLLFAAGVDVIATDIEDVDLTDNQATRQLVLDHQADWVINTSAHTAVDKAESEPDLAHQLNATAPQVIAEACKQSGGRMVHYSTDYVFDGSASTPYSEDDQPNPQSVYGTTKLAGEQAVSSTLQDYFIFRTAWVYSKSGKNFVNTMLRLAEDCDALTVVGDQIGSPTLADDLATMTLQVIHQCENGHSPSYGVFHATGKGVTSWAGFSEEIMQRSGNHHVKITPITTAEYPTPAPRPAYSVLNNDKLKQHFGLELDPWQSALARCLQQTD